MCHKQPKIREEEKNQSFSNLSFFLNNMIFFSLKGIKFKTTGKDWEIIKRKEWEIHFVFYSFTLQKFHEIL